MVRSRDSRDHCGLLAGKHARAGFVVPEMGDAHHGIAASGYAVANLDLEDSPPPVAEGCPTDAKHDDAFGLPIFCRPFGSSYGSSSSSHC